MASLIFKWRCYNTFIRCCVTCTFTTLPAISYVIMHFMLHWGMFCTWHLWLFWCVTHLAAIVYYIIVCPTHSRRYRTNVLFTMSRIFFLSLFCLLLICTWHSLVSVFYLESSWSVYSPTLLRHCGMFRDPNFVTFYLCIYPTLNEEHFYFHIQYNIPVRLLTINMKNCLKPAFH